MFFINSLVILISPVSYRLIILKFLKFKTVNIVLVGISGLFFLSIISSYTHLFLSHNFLYKNIYRINIELKLLEESHHNFYNFPLYWVEKKDFEELTLNNHRLYLTKGKCWNILKAPGS